MLFPIFRSRLFCCSTSAIRRKMATISNTLPTLIVADFDHTLIDKNTDLYVTELAPDGKAPDSLKHLYTKNNWTVYMGEIFKHLHQNQVSPGDIVNHIRGMQLAPGMFDLLKYLKDNEGSYEAIIVSDSNTVFIDEILKAQNMTSVFNKICTNPASFDSNGLLHVEFYHTQDWCKLSTVNMCKGHIMDDYIKERNSVGVKFGEIVYIGDGKNDLCPALRLTENDFVFARKDYTLHKLYLKSEETSRIKSIFTTYESGTEIVNFLASRKH